MFLTIASFVLDYIAVQIITVTNASVTKVISVALTTSPCMQMGHSFNFIIQM